MQRDTYTHLIIVSLLLIIAVNLFILDLKVFSPTSLIQVSDITAIPKTTPFLSNLALYQTNSLSCPDSCVNLINGAVSSLSARTSYQGSPAAYENPKVALASREQYIPLGTGSTQSPKWDDLATTETMIDTSLYGSIKEAYFIASLRNPTLNGAVEAQLYNVTDKHPVWNSNVVIDGSLSQTLTSGKITLDTGVKLYRVQLKSSLSAPSYLDGAKVRIVTQ